MQEEIYNSLFHRLFLCDFANSPSKAHRTDIMSMCEHAHLSDTFKTEITKDACAMHTNKIDVDVVFSSVNILSLTSQNDFWARKVQGAYGTVPSGALCTHTFPKGWKIDEADKKRILRQSHQMELRKLFNTAFGVPTALHMYACVYVRQTIGTRGQ